MLLTITTTHQPATDLGHLLRKHPGKTHVFEQSFGRAHVFYAEATDQRCTACGGGSDCGNKGDGSGALSWRLRMGDESRPQSGKELLTYADLLRHLAETKDG